MVQLSSAWVHYSNESDTDCWSLRKILWSWCHDIPDSFWLKKTKSSVSSNCNSNRSTLTKAWARWKTNLWRFGLQFLPLPLWCIQLIQLVGILAIFHHSSKHQDPSAIADKAISGTSWWCVTLRSRNKPLICSCAHRINNVELLLWKELHKITQIASPLNYILKFNHINI